MNDADWDKSTYCDYANGIFTIPVAGWYQLEFQGITLQEGVSLRQIFLNLSTLGILLKDLLA